MQLQSAALTVPTERRDERAELSFDQPLHAAVARLTGGTAPIFPLDMNVDPDVVYSNPLPHVLILTAIVVGIATTSLGLALIVRIKEEFDTIEEDELLLIERKLTAADNREHGPAMGGRA